MYFLPHSFAPNNLGMGKFPCLTSKALDYDTITRFTIRSNRSPAK
jgi:hypothetical protein